MKRLMKDEMAQGNTTGQVELTLAEARAETAPASQTRDVGHPAVQALDRVSTRPGFDRNLEREFPQYASELIDPVSRRGFMKVMGASLALAGLSGCTKQPDEPIYPYIKQPEDLILGKPLYFATAFPFPTGALPLLVKSDAYRPIKVDGNPDHPMSKGGSDPISQGTLLGLYDPDRSPRVLHRGEQSNFAIFQAEFITAMQNKRAGGGQGLYILSGTVTSPTLAAQWKKAQSFYPQAKWVQYDPVNRDSARIASKAIFGDFYDAQYMLSDADVIVSLDADFLSGINQPGFTKLASDWAARRRLLEPGSESGKKMNRLYAVESSPTTTGYKADHRLALKASDMPIFAAALSSALGANSASSASGLSESAQKFLTVVAKELKASSGRCVVIPGEQADASVYSAAIAINQALGNVGKTVIYTETINPLPSVQIDDLKSLVADMNAGKVDWLIILDSNPVYTAPADLKFADALNKVGKLVHLGSHLDETSGNADWHINAAHYLEAWSDARAYDGSVTIIQPMIDPLYAGKTAHDIIQSMLDDPAASTFDVVRGNWFNGGASSPGLDAPASTPESVVMAGALTGDDDENFRKALHNGVIPNSAFAAKSLSEKSGTSLQAPPSQPGQIEVVFRPDPSVYDGRYANIGWLQELPKPVTNIAWDNAALMSHATAEKLGVAEADVIQIAANGLKIKAPVFAVPGMADDSITLYLGHGRWGAGRVGSGIGFNAYDLRTSDAPLFITSAKITKTSETYDVCSTKSHYTETRGSMAGHGSAADIGAGHKSLEGNEALTRGIVRYATLEEFQKNPGFAHEGVFPEDPDPQTTMFSNYRYDKNAWGLVVDQNSCVGCNACVVSCYAENNIAVVGRHQVKTGRDMQWLRIDTYFEGDLEAPRAHFQPMMCQHCENAPCEQVCPVGATVHTPEGLNAMIYNRCVGTRYCSNNCPYKVRRFNFLLFSDYETESLKLMRNPDVTVRSRGVMEKCTYCVQRIMAAKIEADKDNREIRDGEIITACQQACPTSAITFGNINDPNSKVRKIKEQERNYGVIADLNTRPRTTYVAEVLNPNSELADA
jgi:MoCo/4Fe-4S cofactor protein with predicted Tat translocation signal